MSLSFPSLDPIRNSLLDELTHTLVDTPASKQAEAEENLTLRDNPVMHAIERYTGVLYDSLDASTLSADALSRLAVGSALFGVVRAGDLIPRYRLSAGMKLDGKTLRAWWGSAVTDALADCGFVIDMRSGAYQNLGPVPGALTIRVEQADTGKVVSHFNKKYKGELARALAPHDAASASEVVDLSVAAGFDVSVDGTLLTMRV